MQLVCSLLLNVSSCIISIRVLFCFWRRGGNPCLGLCFCISGSMLLLLKAFFCLCSMFFFVGNQNSSQGRNSAAAVSRSPVIAADSAGCEVASVAAFVPVWREEASSDVSLEATSLLTAVFSEQRRHETTVAQRQHPDGLPSNTPKQQLPL